MLKGGASSSENHRPLLYDSEETGRSTAGSDELQSPLLAKDSIPDASSSVTSEEEDEPVTNWRAIITCAVVFFFITTIVQTLNVIAYLYIKSIDPTITPLYSGLQLAAIKSGHALGTVGFAVFAYSNKSFKKPLLFGRCLSLFALVLYLLIMIFPETNRRYVFLLCFFMQATAEGSLIVVRSFIPRVSSKKDRHSAYGIISGSMMLSIIIGPSIQMAANFLPKADPVGWIQFRSETYPIWICLIFCTIATLLIVFKMEEPQPLKEEFQDPKFSDKLTIAYNQFVKMDKIPLAFCFGEKMIASVSFVSIISAFPPYMFNTLNKSIGETMMIIAASQTSVGFISIATVAVYVLSPISKVIRASHLLFFSLACYSLMYSYAFPWDFISEPIVVRDAAHPFGCNVAENAWCATQKYVKTWLFLPVVVPLFGMAVPTSMIAVDTVYSKLLGNIDQNLMQSALVLSDDLASTVASIVVMKIFTLYGPSAFWLLLAGNAIIGFLAWVPMIPTMKRMNS